MNRVVLALVLASVGTLRADDFLDWARGLEKRGVKVSAACWDLETGKAVNRHQEHLMLVPASTTKVVSTYAMLKTWKPEFQLETEVWGQLAGGEIQGDLVFKGGGDPYLTTERLYTLARELRALGVKRVAGEIKLDQGAFDAQRWGNGWENTSADTTPAISALAVNFGRNAAGRIVTDTDRTAIEEITTVLADAGIPVAGKAGLKDVPVQLLAFRSPPLRMLVGDINKFSNNFMVETLTKKFGDGSWPKGVARIHDFYAKVFGLGPGQVLLTDGSGLSKDNRLSAQTLGIVLRGAWFDFEVGPEFVASLKIIGGEPFRLKHKDENLARRVRVKSGYLDLVRSLCGYIQMPDGRWRVFAILLNGQTTEDDIWDQVSRWAN
ncbi:MAG TPA: D-alanyl-D-alanine carboxypeptidase [Holophagaceae bacterium]|nr:D-alanyl-D-alanine carboxypeptidase [Holophagaceae bacterium]